MTIDATPAGCPGRWIAAAERFGSGREDQLSAWVVQYAGADPARTARDDLERVRTAVRERPPPGAVLQVDFRPGYNVVTFRGPPGNALATLCP